MDPRTASPGLAELGRRVGASERTHCVRQDRPATKRGEPPGGAKKALLNWPLGVCVPQMPDGLPAALRPPVALALAKAVEFIPDADALPGGCLYEPKWDGFLHWTMSIGTVNKRLCRVRIL
jgi:hypothetical protein